MSTNQRVAVVTGGTQGIGRRSAELLAQRGYRVAIIDLHPPTETVKAVEAMGGEAMAFAGDITDEATVLRFAQEVFARWGRVDVLVNNAGISLIAAAEHTSLSDYRRVLEVNLVAPFLLAKTFGEKMLAAGSGSIVNVASVAGASRHWRPRRLQRIEAWLDRPYPHARSRVGWARRTRQRCLPRMGEDGDGCSRPGRRQLLRR